MGKKTSTQQNIQINTFNQGMNKDVHPSLLNIGEYNDARNAVLYSIPNGNAFSLNNEAGFAEILTNPEALFDTLVLGRCSINNYIILFLIRYYPDVDPDLFINNYFNADNILNLPDINNIISASEIGICEKNDDNTYTYRVVINDKDPIYWQDGNVLADQLLNFDVRYQIDCTARVSPDHKVIVYWSDGLNYPRFLNVDIDYTDAINRRQFRHLDEQTRLFDTPQLPYILYNRTLEGGTVRPGVYQFAARYINPTFDPTHFGFISNPIPVVVGQRNEGRTNYEGGPFDHPAVSKSIEFTIHNIDLDYTLLEVVVIYFTGQASNPQVRIIGRYNITEPTMICTFTGDFLDEAPVAIEDLLRKPTIYNSAKHLIQKDGRLFLSNLTQAKTNDLQELANSIRIRWTTRDVILSQDNNFFNDYKEENNTFEFKGYRRNEVYAFGIVGYFRDGSESYVHHIPAGDNFNAGYLEPYFSEFEYPLPPVVPNGYYTSPDGTVLNGTPLRFHRFPDIQTVPHIVRDNSNNLWMRILGIQLEGIEGYLNGNEELRRNLVNLVLVRVRRDSIQNKSVLTQGVTHKLLKFNGRDAKTPRKFNIYFKPGLDDSYVIPGLEQVYDTVSQAISAVLGSFLKPLKSNIDFNMKMSPMGLKPTYAIDPFIENTKFEALRSAQFVNGNQGESLAKDYIGFYSPESTFLKDFNIPLNSSLQSVFAFLGKGERVMNTRLDEYVVFQNGWYGYKTDEPYNRRHRAPYYHFFVDFDTPVHIPMEGAAIRSYKRTKWNDMTANNGQIYDLSAKIGENYQSAVQSEIKVNNYENEGFILLRLFREAPENIVPNPEIKVRVGVQFINIAAPALNPSVFLGKIQVAKDMAQGEYFSNAAKSIIVIAAPILGIIEMFFCFFFVGGTYTGRSEVMPNFEDTLTGRKGSEGDNDCFVNGESIISNPDLEYQTSQTIYNIVNTNTKQYGVLENLLYTSVEVLFSDYLLGENLNDTELKRFDVPLTEPIFNGDTFINKFFYKTGYNAAYKVANIEMSEANKDSLRRQYTLDWILCFLNGGCITNMDVSPPFLPAAIRPNADGVYTFFGAVSTGAEIVNIVSEKVADPLFTLREGVNLRGGYWVYLESSLNCDYRHRPIQFTETPAKAAGYDQFNTIPDPDQARLGVPYYPKDGLQWCFEVSPEFGHSNGYNFQYNFSNNIRVYVPQPLGYVDINRFPTRTIYSESIDNKLSFGRVSRSELSDKFRVFLPFNYEDLPKNKGEITNQFEHSGILYLNTVKSLFRTFVNPVEIVAATTQQIYLGNNSVFRQNAQEIYTLEGGYGGTTHKWGGVNTPYGYLYIDSRQRKIFLLGESLEEISQNGMMNFFVRELQFDEPIRDRFNTESNQYNENYHNNPCNPLGLGITSEYDALNKRVLISIKKGEDFILTNYDTRIFNVLTGKFHTVSFSFLNKKFVSFHDYFLPISLNTDLEVLSLPNQLRNNTLYLHTASRNAETTSEIPITSSYGLFYNRNTPAEFNVTYVINLYSQMSKIFDNIFVLADIIDESVRQGIIQYTTFFDTITCWNDYQSTTEKPLLVYPIHGDELQTNVKVYNNQYQIQVPFAENVTDDLPNVDLNRFDPINVFDPLLLANNFENKPRFRSKYLFVKLNSFNRNLKPGQDDLNNFSIAIHQIINKFRRSIR